VTVPNVVGKTVNQAQTAVKAAGLTVNPDTAKDKPGYDRIVSAENPKAGSKVAAGTHVGLTWSYVKA
jgi:beta-lactam-binding protein with PASTA domain